MLKIANLNFSYGDLQVLWDVNIEVHEGEVVTVVGANGAGKSTLLKNISRLVKPRSGTLSFGGIDLRTCEAHEIVDLGIVQVPEGRKIFPQMTVMENLRMGSFAAKARRKREQNLERVFALFPRLKEREQQLGGTMSGGEQQMLAVARALMARPRLLLLDEPSMGLSPVMVETIFETIATINRAGTTILLVEQNAHAALAVASRGYVLESGTVVAQASAAALRENELVRRVYLGEV